MNYLLLNRNKKQERKIKLPYESIMGATYGLHTKDDNT